MMQGDQLPAVVEHRRAGAAAERIRGVVEDDAGVLQDFVLLQGHLLVTAFRMLNDVGAIAGMDGEGAADQRNEAELLPGLAVDGDERVVEPALARAGEKQPLEFKTYGNRLLRPIVFVDLE